MYKELLTALSHVWVALNRSNAYIRLYFVSAVRLAYVNIDCFIKKAEKHMHSPVLV